MGRGHERRASGGLPCLRVCAAAPACAIRPTPLGQLGARVRDPADSVGPTAQRPPVALATGLTMPFCLTGIREAGLAPGRAASTSSLGRAGKAASRDI